MKTFFAVIFFFVLGAGISPIVLMQYDYTRNMAISMTPDETILALANKINQTAGKQDEQAEEIAFLKELKSKQVDEINALKRIIDMTDCQRKKQSCEKKVSEIDNGKLQIKRPGDWEGSRADMLKKLQDDIVEFEKSKKAATDPGRKADFQASIDRTKNDIKIIETAIAEGEVEKKLLIKDECKDYQKTCHDEQ